MKLKTTLVFFLSLFSFTFYQIQAQCSGATFEENNGIAVMEMEQASLPSNWKKETSLTPFTGNSYIIWRGSNSFSVPGGAKITYTVRINNPGKYRFIWRNIIGVVANSHPTTEHNDSWLKINASDFYGQKGSSKVWPKGSGKSPNPEGASADGFFKVYANSLNWNWGTWTSDFDGHFIYAVFNSAGVYTITVANRSNGHAIDRMVLYKENQWSESQAQSLSRSQTLCGDGGGTPPPPPPPADNEPPTVAITSPADGANIATGSDVAVNLSANDPDGSISKHEIFVNGTKVDTDGSSYSPHVIQNIAAGSYTIRAKVTDNSGATAESSVNITVGSGGGDPPPPPPPGENEDPNVTITDPANGESFEAGEDVAVKLVSDDPDGNISKHEIFVNGTKVDTDGSSYTPHIISDIAEGNYTIRALVTDNEGATDESIVSISVGDGGGTPPPPPPGDNLPPVVNITNPANGANFNVGSNVSVKVSASDSDGSVVKHQVYVNDVLKDTDPADFTPYIITNIQEGNYTIRVVVTDNDGATGADTVIISAGNSTPPPPDNDISLTLIDATTNASIGPLTNGTNITSGSNKNVRADVANGNVQSVYFNLVGATNRNWTENVQPYALFGDLSGNYANGTFNGGSHTLTVEAYSGQNKTGTKLETLVISFNVAGSGKSAIAYPNPVKEGPVSIRLPEEIQGQAAYAVISPSGTEVARGTIDSTNIGDNQSIQIATENMKNDGVYYLVIQANYNSYTVPIIKQ